MEEIMLKKTLIMLIFVSILAAMTACGNSPMADKSSSSETSTSSQSSHSAEISASSAEKKPNTRSITDTAGRTLTVPAEINKVYSLSPVGTIFMYTLAPEKIAGLSWKPTEGEKKYTLESFQKLPLLGGNFGQGQTMSTEEVLKVNPDIILVLGDVGHTDVASADKIQEQVKIPVVVVEMKIDSIDKAYRFMGDLLGVKERAGELAEYTRKTINDVKATAKTIPEEKRVRVYYAEDKNGQSTDPSGSPHAEVLDLVGGINVAKVEITKGYGRTPVSIEQVLSWNPETIIVCFDQGFAAESSPYETILSDKGWSNVQAVKDKKVYMIPYLPFNWFDRPPSVNRIIGVKWLANLLYPDYFKYDMRQETKEFYQKFYHRALTDQELDEILANAQ
jgi:iron complex transport system substrate-binding protein